jgi:hypothetical protein
MRRLRTSAASCMVIIMSRSLLLESAALLEAQSRSAGLLGSSVVPRIHPVLASDSPHPHSESRRLPNLSATDHGTATDNLLVYCMSGCCRVLSIIMAEVSWDEVL